MVGLSPKRPWPGPFLWASPIGKHRFCSPPSSRLHCTPDRRPGHPSFPIDGNGLASRVLAASSRRRPPLHPLLLPPYRWRHSPAPPLRASDAHCDPRSRSRGRWRQRLEPGSARFCHSVTTWSGKRNPNPVDHLHTDPTHSHLQVWPPTLNRLHMFLDHYSSIRTFFFLFLVWMPPKPELAHCYLNCVFCCVYRILHLNCVVSLDVTQPCTRSDAVPLVISAAVRCVYAKFEIKGSFITFPWNARSRLVLVTVNKVIN